jgi:hypothetical protein
MATTDKVYRLMSAATTNLGTVKASPARLRGYDIYNNSAAAKFVKLYNLAANPTLASDVPVMTIALAANSGRTLGLDEGITFSVGIAHAITGAIGNTDTTAVAANDVIIHLIYR